MNTIKPHITLVGAGPGDPELLTIKALRALEGAKVVLYDALCNPTLLNYAKSAKHKICVGKRAGKHSYKQEDIHLLMVQYAYRYGSVVRLKGGDPFVFGRGFEEVEYAQAFGISVDVIPGISSAIAVPASQQIPVTHRGMSESFWVVTATTKNGKLSADISLAAQSSGTVVILMGLRKVEVIAEIYRELGRQDLPAMVIQNGTLENEKMVVGTIDEIPQLVKQASIATPAIIVVGQTVSLHSSFVSQLQKHRA